MILKFAVTERQQFLIIFIQESFKKKFEATVSGANKTNQCSYKAALISQSAPMSSMYCKKIEEDSRQKIEFFKVMIARITVISASMTNSAFTKTRIFKYLGKAHDL